MSAGKVLNELKIIELNIKNNKNELKQMESQRSLLILRSDTSESIDERFVVFVKNSRRIKLDLWLLFQWSVEAYHQAILFAKTMQNQHRTTTHRNIKEWN